MRRSLLAIALAVIGTALPAADRPGTLTIAADRVGPIGTAFVFGEKALRAALPGYRVKVRQVEGEGGSYTEAQVSRGGTPVLRVIAAAAGADGKAGVYSVAVTSPAVENALGPKVGTPFATAALYHPSCEPGMEEQSGKVLCTTAAANLQYLFGGRWDGPDGELPPEKVLNGFRIEEIVWSNPQQQ